jgi:hypothetical protein
MGKGNGLNIKPQWEKPSRAVVTPQGAKRMGSPRDPSDMISLLLLLCSGTSKCIRHTRTWRANRREDIYSQKQFLPW